MPSWADRIRAHDVHNRMPTLGATIDKALVREAEAQTIDDIERIRSILAFIGKRVAGMDPALTPLSALDQLAAYLNNAESELQSYITNGSAGHIANANGQMESALLQVAQVNISMTPDETGALAGAAAEYRKTLHRQLEQAQRSVQQFSSDLAAAQARLGDLATEVSTEKTRVTSLSATYQEQFTLGQDTRGKEFTDAQGERQTSFNKLLADYSQKLTDQNADFTREREAVVKRHDDEVQELQSRYEATARGILDTIEAHKTAVEKLVGVIGNLGVTSGYVTSANHNRTMAYRYQLGTIVSLGLLVAVAVYAFLPALTGSAMSWESFGGRIAVTVAVGVLAAYTRSQADRFLDNERRDRKHALEFEALGPFVAPLSDAQKAEFRIQVGDRSFGRDEMDGRQPRHSPANAIDVFAKSKAGREFLVELVKAVRSA